MKKISKRSERRQQEIAKLKGIQNNIFYSRLIFVPILCNWMTSKLFICFFLCLIRCFKKVSNVDAINQNKNLFPVPCQWFFPNPRIENITHFVVFETFRHLRQLINFFYFKIFLLFCHCLLINQICQKHSKKSQK